MINCFDPIPLLKVRSLPLKTTFELQHFGDAIIVTVPNQSEKHVALFKQRSGTETETSILR